MSGISSIGNIIGKGISKATNARPAQWLGKKFQQDPESALALATVTSIILKDGIGCAMYVTQSLNNKKIPDEKRKFVAALDLTNGVLMIAAQIAMFFAMRKYSGPIFEKLFKKSFNAENKSNIISRIRMLFAKEGKVPPKKLPIDHQYEKVKKDSLDLFKFVADIAAATIIGKRVIVPLIATPLAKKVEKKMENRNAFGTITKDVEHPSQQVKEEEPEKPADNVPKTAVPIFENNGNSNLLDKFKNN